MKCMKMGVLLIGLLAIGEAAAQELLCPETGIPMSQDPGCVIPNYNNSPPQQPLPPQQPTGEWKTTWGAIGGNALKGILGAAVGLPTEKEAVQAALADCRAKGGGAGCKLDISYYNQCAVLVTGNKVYNTASAATVEEASQIGINKCAKEDANCRVFYSACSKPEFVNY
jgi:hypothetical protein